MAIEKKKKKFFEVEMPIIGKTTHLQAFEISQLQGKHIKYDLSRILKGKNMMIQLIVEIKENKATSKPKKIELMPTYIKRMMRKGTNYVEDSFSAETKDSIIRVKPFLITRRKVTRRVRKDLRNKAREELINYAKSKKTEKIFDDILKNKLQKELSLTLKKIYPLSLCEIRVLKIEKELTKKPEDNEQKNI